MSQSTEYSNPTVQGASCAYARLNNYNQGVPGTNPPVPATTTSGFYVVPTWNYRPPYDTLVKGSNCGGYATIISGYGKHAEKCKPKYAKKSCNTIGNL